MEQYEKDAITSLLYEICNSVNNAKEIVLLLQKKWMTQNDADIILLKNTTSMEQMSALMTFMMKKNGSMEDLLSSLRTTKNDEIAKKIEAKLSPGKETKTEKNEEAKQPSQNQADPAVEDQREKIRQAIRNTEIMEEDEVDLC